MEGSPGGERAAGGGARPAVLGRWLPTAALSLLIFTFAPLGSNVARWSREAPSLVVWTFGIGFVAAAAAFLGWAIVRLRRDPWRRLPWVLLAVGLVVLQQVTSDRGEAVERAVERMHFLLFGALAATAFVAARRGRRRDGGESTGGLLAAATSLVIVAYVAVVDELVQDALMARAGEAFDVGLNLFSGVVGLIASVGLFPMRARGGDRRALRALLLASAGLPLAFALLLDRAHLGTTIEAEGLGAFRSFFSEETLERLNRDRERHWARRLPAQPPFAWWVWQDDFLVEGGWHVHRRNRALEAGDLETVWIENTIVERFYSSLLEAPFPDDAHPYRLKPWDVDRLREAKVPESLPDRRAHELVSNADRGRIWVSPTRSQTWTIAAIASLVLVAASWRVGATRSE